MLFTAEYEYAPVTGATLASIASPELLNTGEICWLTCDQGVGGLAVTITHPTALCSLTRFKVSLFVAQQHPESKRRETADTPEIALTPGPDKCDWVFGIKGRSS
jgi:hypothetical protein